MDDLGQNLDILRQERNKHIKRHEWHKAIHTIEKMIELLPTPSFYTRKGMIEIKIKKYREAIQSLKQALHLEPGYLKARQILMKLSSRMALESDPLDNLLSNSQAMLIYSESVNSQMDSFDSIDKGITNADGTLLLMPESDEPLEPVSPMSDITNMSVLPQQFGPYRDLRVIGSGSAGIVYRAYNPKQKKYVAIKVLHTENSVDSLSLKKEAEVLAQLHHPNIVNIYEAGVFEGSHYIVMDYIKGETLGEYMKTKSYTYKDALQIIKFIALAMDYAHQNAIIHCDLKPSNIIIEQDTSLPIVMDFGLATKVKRNNKQLVSDVAGTPRYMAPEQARGWVHRICPGTDVYAIGTILYEMLTKFPAIAAPLPKEALSQIIHKSVIPPRKRNISISPEIEAICMKCLAKEITHRYLNAKELVKDIDRLFSGEEVKAPKINWKSKLANTIRNRKKTVFVVTILIMVGIGMMISVHEYQQKKHIIALEKSIAEISQQSYTLEDLKTKYPLAEQNNSVYFWKLQRDLEISLEQYAKIHKLLIELTSLQSSPELQQQIHKVNADIAELILFSQYQNISNQFYLNNTKNFNSDLLEVIQTNENNLNEKAKNIIKKALENKENHQRETILLSLLEHRSRTTSEILISQLKQANPQQQQLILDYFIITKDMGSTSDGKNIKDWLIEELANIEITAETQDTVKLYIAALAHFRGM